MATNIDYDTLHLTKGDAYPPFNGKLRIFGNRLCPYVQRAILALNAKNLDYEVVNLHFLNRPEWYAKSELVEKIPTLEIEEGVTVNNSLITPEYIDDAYPGRSLLPKDPLKRAWEKMIVRFSRPIQALYYKMLTYPDTLTYVDVATYHKTLKGLEEQLKRRGTKFFGGEEPSFADYMMFPWFERFVTFDHDERIRIDHTNYKLLLDYIDGMFKDPVVLKCPTPRQLLKGLHSQGMFKFDATHMCTNLHK